MWLKIINLDKPKTVVQFLKIFIMINKLFTLSNKWFSAILLIMLFMGVVGIPEALGFFQEPQEQNQNYKQYKGKIMDSDSKKPLVFATLSIEDTNISTISNTEGEFILKVPNTIDEANVLIS